MSFEIQQSSLELLLVIIELALFIPTLLLLVLNRRELRSRQTLIRQVSSATDAISRQEYFVAVVEALQGARNYVHASVTGSSPVGGESDVIRRLLDAMADTAKRGVEVRYMLPYLPDRIKMGKMYRTTGAKVRFHPDLIINDARFMIVDGRTVVIGVPDRIGEGEPTRKGYAVPSENIASLFEERFESRWNSQKSKGYEEYLLELVKIARSANPGSSAEAIASSLGIEKQDLDAALSRKG